MDSLHNKVYIEETDEYMGTGWIPPYPDLRDYTPENEKIAPALIANRPRYQFNHIYVEIRHRS